MFVPIHFQLVILTKVFFRQKSGGSQVDWSSLQAKIEHCNVDVLLFLDCCHTAQADCCYERPPSTSLFSNQIELVAACWMYTIAPQLGNDSFTTACIGAMSACLRWREYIPINKLVYELRSQFAKLRQSPNLSYRYTRDVDETICLFPCPKDNEDDLKMIKKKKKKLTIETTVKTEGKKTETIKTVRQELVMTRETIMKEKSQRKREENPRGEPQGLLRIYKAIKEHLLHAFRKVDRYAMQGDGRISDAMVSGGGPGG